MIARTSISSDSAMIQLYVGVADCYKMANMYDKQSSALLEQYQKYNPQKHSLLYNAAFIYYHRLKDIPKSIQYLGSFLRTRPKESPKQEYDENGIPVITDDNRYNAAEAWLKDIRQKQKEERFFKGEEN